MKNPNKRIIIIIIAALFLVLFFAACNQSDTVAKFTAEPTQAVVNADPTPPPYITALPTFEPTPVPTPVPTPTPIPTPTPVPTPFAFAWVSDTQILAWRRPDAWIAMANWIVDNREAMNFIAVLHVGDLVDDRDDAAQWQNISAGMDIIKGKLPIYVVAGNHDVSQPGFDYKEFLKQDFCDVRDPERLFKNGQCWIQPLDAGGRKLLLLGLGWQATDDSYIAWAGEQANKYPDHTVIIIVHSFLAENGFLTKEGVRIETLFADHPNIRLLICGHKHGERKWEKTYEDGHTVYALMFNLQDEHDLGNGIGYLRILTFDPVSGDMDCVTYSPILDKYNYFGEERDSFTVKGVLAPL